MLRQRGGSVLRRWLAAGVENQAADGIGGVAAILQDVIHGGVAGDDLVLAKGGEEIGEGLSGNVASPDGLS